MTEQCEYLSQCLDCTEALLNYRAIGSALEALSNSADYTTFCRLHLPLEAVMAAS